MFLEIEIERRCIQKSSSVPNSKKEDFTQCSVLLPVIKSKFVFSFESHLRRNIIHSLIGF